MNKDFEKWYAKQEYSREYGQLVDVGDIENPEYVKALPFDFRMGVYGAYLRSKGIPSHTTDEAFKAMLKQL